MNATAAALAPEVITACENFTQAENDLSAAMHYDDEVAYELAEERLEKAARQLAELGFADEMSI